MNKFVIDAYAWIEYFDGTKLGDVVKNIVEDTNNIIYTNVITIAELSSFFKRKNKDFNEAKKVLSSLSLYYPINKEFSEEVGELHADIKKRRKHIGLVDVFLILTSRKLKAKVVTGDEDFRGLREAFMIK